MPLAASDGQVEEMNHFLRANKIIDIRKELAMVDGNSCWTFCVTYMQPVSSSSSVVETKFGKVDYKEVLDEETFRRFCLMRKIRKAIADNDAVPAYAVFTDAELAVLAKLSEVDAAALLKVPGIGKKKVEKYGETFCREYNALINETQGVSDREDSGMGQPL